MAGPLPKIALDGKGAGPTLTVGPSSALPTVTLDGPKGASPPSRHGGGGIGGFFSSAGHWLGQKSDLALHDIEATPAGLYQVAKVPADEAKATYDLVTGNFKGASKAAGAAHNLSKQIGASTVQSTKASLEHPLRDPFQTALNVLPLTHGLGAAGMKVAAASKALDGGDFAGAAKALVRKPEMPMRTLQQPGSQEPVNLHASQSPVGRAAQFVYDKAMQKALDANPERGGIPGRMIDAVRGHAVKRAAGAFQESERRAQRMSQVDINQLQQQAKTMTPKRASLVDKISRNVLGSPRVGEERLRQAALELRSIQVKPEEAAAYHAAQAEKGVSPELNSQVARMYGEVAQRNMLRVSDGKVRVNAADYPGLAKADAAVARVQRAGEQLVHRYGLMGEEGQQVRIDKPGQVYNGEGARAGEGFVSEKPLIGRQPQSLAAESRGATGNVGAARKPINAPGSKAGTYTGEGRAQGQVPADVTKTVAAHAKALNRYANTVEQRIGLVRKFGHAARRSVHDVLIQVPGEKTGVLDAETKALLGRGDLNFDEAQTLRQKLDSLDAEFTQEPSSKEEAPLGQQAPAGKMWVDSRALKAVNDSAAAARSSVGKFADAVNAGVTAGTVFFKPAHIPQRFFTDAITNVLQGSVKAGKANRDLWKQLSEHDRARALAAAGVHGYQAMPHEGDFFTARAARAGSSFFAKHVDAAFRANSLLYEAKKAGFADTPHAFTDFLDKLESRGHGLDAATWAKVDWTAKRADRAAIAYDRLSPAEKRTVARAIWFYPWLKGSAGFVGHTIVEHPFKAAALNASGKQGEKLQQQRLGPMPSYEYPLIPLGGGAMPNTTSVESWMPTSGATSLLDATARPPDVLSNVLPVYAALLALNKTPPGRPPTTPVSNVLNQLLSTLPESHLLPQGRSRSHTPPLFPASPWQAFLHSFASPVIPRRTNVAKLHRDYRNQIHPRG